VKNRKEIYIALLFLAALSLFIWGFNFMKGKNIFMNERLLYAVYERTAGLNINNPVLLNGHQIGLVRDIRFIPNDPDAKLIVQLGITSDVPISSDSRAVIETSLLGSNMINIVLGNSLVQAKNRDTLLSNVATSLQEQFSIEMLPVKKKAENVMLSLDTVLTVIRAVFNEETRMNLTIAMENIRRSIDMLKNTTYNIDTLVSTQKTRLASIFANVESITGNIESNNQTLSLIITNIGAVSDSLAKIQFAETIRSADKAIHDFSEVMNKVNQGEGSLGLLINDKKLYKELEHSSAALNTLIRDIQENPKRYLQFSVFGTKDKKAKKE
jgi:phospholipid/cholesterol/gamma-HCH transport system substrate-binding protein